MASRTVLVDDLNGKEDDVRTVRLTYDGTAYTLDLGKTSRVALDAALRPFLTHARSRPRDGESEASKIRSWARVNGVQVPPRGKIPADVLTQYKEATGG